MISNQINIILQSFCRDVMTMPQGVRKEWDVVV